MWKRVCDKVLAGVSRVLTVRRVINIKEKKSWVRDAKSNANLMLTCLCWQPFRIFKREVENQPAHKFRSDECAAAVVRRKGSVSCHQRHDDFILRRSAEREQLWLLLEDLVEVSVPLLFLIFQLPPVNPNLSGKERLNNSIEPPRAIGEKFRRKGERTKKKRRW